MNFVKAVFNRYKIEKKLNEIDPFLSIRKEIGESNRDSTCKIHIIIDQGRKHGFHDDDYIWRVRFQLLKTGTKRLIIHHLSYDMDNKIQPLIETYQAVYGDAVGLHKYGRNKEVVSLLIDYAETYL